MHMIISMLVTLSIIHFPKYGTNHLLEQGMKSDFMLYTFLISFSITFPIIYYIYKKEQK